MGIEMEVWEESRADFEEILRTLQEAYVAFYDKPACRCTVYWDAVRYDLYSVVPIYAEGKV